jgi:hypothetical protein
MSLRDEECNLFKKWQSERKFKNFAKDGVKCNPEIHQNAE